MTIEFSLLNPAAPITGTEEVVLMQAGGPVRALISDLSDNALLSQLVDMTNPYLVSATAALSAAHLGAWVVVTGTGSDFLVNLPPVTLADKGAQVLLSVSPNTIATITVQSAPASGLTVQGQSFQEFIVSESALFVFDGAEWKMPMLRRTPIVAKLVNGAARTLTVGSFTYLPLAAGAQEMIVAYQRWFDTDHFIAPRAGYYQFEADLWLTGLTGAPAQVDFGFLAGSTSPFTAAPPNDFFVRRNVTTDTYQTLSYSRGILLGKGQRVVPTIRAIAPLTTASIEAAATLISRMGVSEILFK